MAGVSRRVRYAVEPAIPHSPERKGLPRNNLHHLAGSFGRWLRCSLLTVGYNKVMKRGGEKKEGMPQNAVCSAMDVPSAVDALKEVIPMTNSTWYEYIQRN